MVFWIPEDAVAGIQSPFQYKHMKILRRQLLMISFWPQREMGEKYWRFWWLHPVYMMWLNVYCLSGIVGYLVYNRKNHTFLELGHMFMTTFMTMLSGSRVFIMPLHPRYRKLMARFMKEIHLFHFKGDSDYAMKVHRRVHLFCHWYTIFLSAELIMGVSLFNISNIYMNYYHGLLKYPVLQNATYEQAVYYLFPEDALYKRSTYLYIHVFNWYASFMCCITLLMVDLCVFVIVFHVHGHFNILLNNLNTFPRPAAELNNNKKYDDVMFSSEELKDVSVKLKECINYHRFVANVTSDMSDTFGPMLFLYFMFQQVSTVVLLLECSEMTMVAMIRYATLTVTVYQQLIQLSVIFEMIGTASEKLKDAVYSIPWECMDTPNRKTCFIFLMLSQRSVSVKAMGLAQVGVTTMATIIKTSVSYFTFLRTVAD